MTASNSFTKKKIHPGISVVWYIVGLINTLLGIRFILKFLGANPLATFTDFIYVITEPLTIPFSRVFGTDTLKDYVFEWTTLLAMVVYTLIGWGMVKLLMMLKTISPLKTSNTPV